METAANKKKIASIISITIFSVIVILLGIFVPKVWSSYEEHSGNIINANKSEIEKIEEYPLEIEITEQDAKYFVDFFYDYSIGITDKNINLLDEITQIEMIDFCRVILSEEYSSSKVIPQAAMDDAIEKYFGITNLSYETLGYQSFEVYEEYNAEKVFNVTKLKKLEKDSDLYLVYADCIDKKQIHEETYQKDDVEDVYIFTLKKIIEEKQEETLMRTEVKYVLQKVEKEVEVEETENIFDNSDIGNKNEEKE